MRKTTFSKELYRWYGEQGESFLHRIFRKPEIKFLYYFRKAQEAHNPLAKLYFEFRLLRISRKTNIQIPSRTKIGEGFYIGHCGRIIINPEAVLGKNVNIATGVTIGQENRGKRKGSPTIGDNCWIGTNAVVVGNVTIGHDVLIAPLAFVNFDVPAHSVVVGNPARIIPKNNATEGYIENTI